MGVSPDSFRCVPVTFLRKINVLIINSIHSVFQADKLKKNLAIYPEGDVNVEKFARNWRCLSVECQKKKTNLEGNKLVGFP